TKSGPTVQADSATVNAATFSSANAVGLWSIMGGLLVSAGGRRRRGFRPAFCIGVDLQLLEQPADVVDRRDARRGLSHGTPPRNHRAPASGPLPRCASPACAARRRTPG